MYRLLVYVLLFIIPIVAAVENSQHAEVGQLSHMAGEVLSPHEKLVQDTIINDVEKEMVEVEHDEEQELFLEDSENWTSAGLPNSPVVGHVRPENNEYCTVTGALLPEVRRIVYIKTHKTGSTTFGGIMYRFGAIRGLRFLNIKSHVLPVGNNKRMIDQGPADISLYHHNGLKPSPLAWTEAIVWYRKYIPDAAFVTIVREPVARFISKWNYEERPNGSGAKSLEDYTRPDSLSLPLLANGMCGDLGINSAVEVDRFLTEGAKDFPIIIVLDRFVESLVALKLLFHWRMTEDILHLKALDSCRSDQKRWDGKPLVCAPSKESLSPKVIEAIEQLNEMDRLLYEGANKRLDSIISQLGPLFHEELETFKAEQSTLTQLCTADRQHPKCARYIMDDISYEKCIKKGQGFGNSFVPFGNTNRNSN